MHYLIALFKLRAVKQSKPLAAVDSFRLIMINTHYLLLCLNLLGQIDDRQLYSFQTYTIHNLACGGAPCKSCMEPASLTISLFCRFSDPQSVSGGFTDTSMFREGGLGQAGHPQCTCRGFHDKCSLPANTQTK